MNSIGPQVFLSAPPFIPPALPVPPPDTDVFIPEIPKRNKGISFPASPSGYARIFLPTPKGPRFIGDPAVKTIPNFLPPAKDQPPFAGDRPDPEARLYLAGRANKPLAEDKIAEWMSEQFLKMGFLSDSDFDAVIFSTMLKLGERFSLTRLAQALVVERDWSWFSGFRVVRRLARLHKEGVVAEVGRGPIFAIRSPKSARSKYVLNYIIANRRRAEILGLVERPEQKGAPRTNVFDLAELLRRQEAILSRAQDLGDHSDERVKRLAGKIEKRAMERMALKPRRLAELECQLKDLEESAKRWEGVLGITGEIIPAPPKPEAQPRDKDPVMTGDDLEMYLAAIESELGKILAVRGPASDDLAPLEDRYLEWLDGAPARQSEIRETLRTLQRKSRERPRFSRGETDDEPKNEARPETQTSIEIDWSQFPRLLKPREALRILMRNGFTAVSGAKSAVGGHQHFEHPMLRDKFTISTSSNFFREEIAARNLKAALRALSEQGVCVKW